MDEKHVGSQTWKQWIHAFWLLFRQFILGATLRWFVRVFIWFSLNWSLFWSSCRCIEVGYQLISLHMLAYVKAYKPEQTIFKNCRLNTWRNVASYVVQSHNYVHTHTHTEKQRSHSCFKAHSHKQTNKQAVLEPSAPWLPCHRTPGPFETTVCLLSISKWCSHCITHTHTHCPCVCQGVGLGPTA